MAEIKRFSGFGMYVKHVKNREGRKSDVKHLFEEDFYSLAAAERQHMTGDEPGIFELESRKFNEIELKKSRRMKKADENWNSSEESSSFHDKCRPENGEGRKLDRERLLSALRYNLGGQHNLSEKIVYESFFVVSAQNFVDVPAEFCVPVEIAVVEFSLSKGILNEYNVLLKPSCQIPAGVDFSSQIDETHKIFPDRLPLECRDDYENVLNEIHSLYFKQERLQFRFFVVSNQFKSVKNALTSLSRQTGFKKFRGAEQISNIEDLLIVFNDLKGSETFDADLNGFNRILEETAWDYEPHTLCPYHLRCQSKLCSLAFAKKSCYCLFDRMKDSFGIQLTEKHVPRLLPGGHFRYPSSLSAVVAPQTCFIAPPVFFPFIYVSPPVEEPSIRRPQSSSLITARRVDGAPKKGKKL